MYFGITKDEQPCLPGTRHSQIQAPAYLNMVLNVYILQEKLAVWSSIAELQLIQRYMKVVMSDHLFKSIEESCRKRLTSY
jgi:hypothetical protein